MITHCMICLVPITEGTLCADCKHNCVIPADDVVIEIFDDPDGEALWKYRREREDEREPVDYQEQRRRMG